MFEMADQGTLFLDEIGELPLTIQVKLLRVLEDRRVQRVGGTAPRAVDVRVVAATHRDLATEARTGGFRQDLYFRLNGISLTIPPLRARTDEIPDLARLFAGRTSKIMGKEAGPLSIEALAALVAYPWPGNVRELRNVIERAVVLGDGGPILAEHLALDGLPPEAPSAERAGGSLKDDLDGVERRRIMEALDACSGNQTKAAALLAMPRRTLVARLASYGVSRPRKKS